MASSASSTKKAARLAQKGKGKRVRFQGGALFPAAVAATLILGIGTIVYARQSLPDADESPPTINDHWHAAYGFNLCGEWYQLDGDLEERDSQGQFTNVEFLRSGIHSHNDGVIHWHPFTSRAVGRNATLGVFLDTYGVEITNDSLTFPETNALGGMTEYLEDETQCNGEDAEVSVVAWESFTDTDTGQRFISNMDEVHIDNDGMVFGIYFGTDDVDPTMPPWAQQLPSLAENDLGQIRPLETESTIELGSVPADSTDGSTPPADTEPVTSEVADESVTTDVAGTPDTTDG